MLQRIRTCHRRLLLMWHRRLLLWQLDTNCQLLCLGLVQLANVNQSRQCLLA